MKDGASGAKARVTLPRRGFLGACAAVGAGAALGVRSLGGGTVAAMPQPQDAGVSVIPSTCNMCVNRCGIMCYVKNGVLEKIDGDPRNPLSGGGLCAKGQAGVMQLYDPDRIKYPMIRTGKRGEGKWRRASWDEAFDYTADHLARIVKKHGPQALLWSSSTELSEAFFVKLGKYIGTPNFARHATLCLASRNVGYFATLGGVPGSDLANARYILMFGANRLESFETPDNINLVEGLARGARLVVVDPRMTVTAAKGQWLPIRPRTDMALTLALMHVLIKHDLYDKTFVRNATVGFPALKAHVKKYTPEWAAKETGIPAATIVSMAHEMAAAAPAVVIYPGRRSSWYTNDTQFRRTLGMLTGLLGAIDARGASNFGAGAVTLGDIEWEIEPLDVAERVDGFNEKNFPLAAHEDGGYVHLRDTLLQGKGKYPVKGWMVYKQNPLAAMLDSSKTLKLMEQMDFIGVIDIQPSQTAWMADIILPETTYLERLDPIWAPPARRKFIGIRQPVVAPQFESKPLLDIIKGLAAKLDKRHHFETPLSKAFNFTIEQYVDAQLKALPIDRKTLMKEGIWLAPPETAEFGRYRRGEKKFSTPSGKIEFVAERFQRNGYPPLPVYEPPKEEPGKQRLVTGRPAWYTHSSNQNNPWLNALQPENDIWIHPDVAHAKGIRDGEVVRVRSAAGEVRIKALVTPRIRKDTVYMAHGFGSRSTGQTTVKGRGGADETLMVSQADTITNNQAMHETFVEILKV
jgi:thiosulfate reductase/polysulfide reductase chain A